MAKKKEHEDERYYYVDESGDLTFYNSKKQLMLGKNGVSKTFMLGIAQIPNPIEANAKFKLLKEQILGDSELLKIPSVRPEARKTSCYFHCKDDHPIIRQKVFDLIEEIKPKFYVIIRRKEAIVPAIETRHSWLGTSFSDSEIYEDLLKRNAKNLLHQADENHVIVAQRGTSIRGKGLTNALMKAKANYENSYNKESSSNICIQVAQPSEHSGLQIADYGLWFVQRAFEKNDFQYFERFRSFYSVIIDMDDTREKDYGVYYTKANPLTIEKMKPL